MSVIIDTNVLIAANGGSAQVTVENKSTCVLFLETVKEQNGPISMDSLNLIFEEYANHCNHKGQPGVGDAFFKWLYLNQGYDTICEKVAITTDNEWGFDEFPHDENLRNFDRSDRKFVAVALTSLHNPIICNATDSDWKIFSRLLAIHGVTIRQLCPNLLSHHKELETATT